MVTISRRTALAGVTAAAGVGLLGSRIDVASAQPTQPLRVLNLDFVQDYDVAKPAEALLAYGWLHAATTLQGLANRSGPRLYADFMRGDELGEKRLDQYWLALMRDRSWPSPAEPRPIASVRDAVREFRSSVRGAVVWDPSVPATSNVASTVAGCEGLVAVPYDTTAGSAYRMLVDAPGDDASALPVRRWLVQPDGSPLFSGVGTIPGTRRRSTGSPKADAYLWAVERYLASGRCDPTELAFFLDAYWLRRVATSTWPHPIQNTLLSNHDFGVSRKGFFFDLSLWPDEAPEDDLDQQPGTDLAVLEEILATAARGARGRMPAVRGFVPWAFKYTSAASSTSRQHPVHAEWKFVEIISRYGCYLDADAEGLDPMANASAFQHHPVPARYPERPVPTSVQLRESGYLDSDGTVVPKRYVLIYTGDYDSAAWLYHAMPRMWDDDKRGSVPLNWAFNPALAQRMPLGMVHARETATEADHFISGDSGLGYVAPGAFEHADSSVAGNLLRTWQQANTAAFHQWGLTVTGFVIDGTTPALSDAGYRRTYGQFSQAGIVGSKVDPLGTIDDTPFIRMGSDLSGAGALIGDLAGVAYEVDLSGPPLRPGFHALRTILKSPSWHAELMNTFSKDQPPPPFEGTRTVSVKLGDPNISDGLQQTDAADGRTEAVTVAARSARRTVAGVNPTGNRYFYFAIDDDRAHDGAFEAEIRLEYLDEGTDTFHLQYDGTDPYSGAGSVQRSGSGEWRTATFTVRDARFANREQGTFDLRVECPAGTNVTISTLTIAVTARRTYGRAEVVFCDATTFFELLRRQLVGQVEVRCSAARFVAGQPSPMVLRIVNHAQESRNVTLELSAGPGWALNRPSVRVRVPRGGSSRVNLTVTAPAGATDGVVTATAHDGTSTRTMRFAPDFVDKDYAGVDEVMVSLGATNEDVGIHQLELEFDGTSEAGSAAGRSYRTARQRPNGFTDEHYLYFDVDDTYLIDEDGVDAEVTVEYLDEPEMTFRLDYDAKDRRAMLDGVHTPTSMVRTQGSGRWRSHTFRLRDGVFGNRINGSPDARPRGVADFRLATPDPLKVATLTVRRR